MKHHIWTDKPLVIDYDTIERPVAEQSLWETAVYPVGNGRLGCTAFGAPQRERIQFNQESLWVGNEDNTGGYQPFGDVYVDFAPDAEQSLPYTDYRRELSIDRAVQTISYRSNGVRYSREYFASYPAQVLVLRYSADQPSALSGTVSMGNVHEIPISTEADGTLVMRGDTSNFWLWQLHLDDPKRLMANREYASDKIIPLDFEAHVRVLHDGGSIAVDGDQIRFANCNTLTLLLAADTNYVADRSRGWHGEHPHDRVCAQISAAAARSFEQLLDEHIADYQGLFGRVAIDLGGTPATLRALPTAERLQHYREAYKSGKTPEDRELEVLLYQYARYLMISSSRPGHGGLPTNLQGIWLINKRPSWRCDFHTDINIQMNYWFVNTANISECFEPFPRWIDAIREVRKEETRRVLNVERGWLMRSENGIFGGSTWHIQKGDSAWLCQNLWDHYAFTRDLDYLRRYAYPVMREISEFWLDHLKERPDGKLVAPAGRSPEHGPVDVDGVTYDQQLCAELFDNTIAAADALGVDENLRAELANKRARLLGPQTGRWGQLQEWAEDIDDPEDDHRHINHLIGLYPGRQVSPEATPEVASAARVGLVARRDHGAGHPAWSRVWKAAMFARLKDAEAAYGQICETLATHIFDNLWAVHPPFQIDANFGYAAAFSEMLIQSHLQASDKDAEDGQGKAPERRNANPESVLIHLLPALPGAWQDGRITGLRVRGGFEVDMHWANGELTHCELRNCLDTASRCVVRYGEERVPVTLGAGEKWTR